MRALIGMVVLALLAKTSFSQKYEADSAMVYTTNGCKLIDYYYGDSLTYSWKGDCTEGWVNGPGELTKIEKGVEFSVISANYKKGVPQGVGTYKILGTNEKYKGSFVNGQMIGEGEYWNDLGDYYKGQILNFMLHGNGKMTYANGSSFEGVFNVGDAWTGNYTNLKDEVIMLYRGEKIDKPVSKTLYNPKLGEELTEYFDTDWKRCDKKDAAYFRKITYEAPNKPKGKVRDFYINGSLQNEFYALNIDYNDDQCTFYKKSKIVFYYENGNISSQVKYDHQSRKVGMELDYYESGELYSESQYGNMGMLNGPYREYYKSGELMGYSKFENGKRVNNAFWSITEDGIWMGIYRLDIADEFSRFEVDDKCAEVFEYSDILFIKIPDKDCIYFNSKIVETEQKFPFSIEMELIIDEPHKDKLAGLIFNYKDDNNFSLLKFSGSGLYSILSFTNNTESTLVPWTQLDMKKDKEQMEFDVLLTFSSNELILDVNNSELNRIPFVPHDEMVYGLFSTGKGLFVVREFGQIVYYDEETSAGFQNFAEAERDGKTNTSDMGILENEESEYTGNGSGFLLTNDGYIGTNYHVIEDASEIKVVFELEEGKFDYLAEVIHVDKDNDVAILKVALEDRNLHVPYTFGGKLQEVGTSVFALGYPYADVMGSEIKYTDGSINARTGIQGDVRYYQVSAPVQPGNSGGPCFNKNGELIGIVSAGLDDSVIDNQNVNYVLKITYLKNLMELLPTKSTSVAPKVSKYSSTQEMIKEYKSFVPIIFTK